MKANETFHVATTVAMRYGDVQGTMLNNYVFGAGEEGISMAEMGPGMIYNHHYPPNYERRWDGDQLGYQNKLFSDQTEAHTTFTGVRDIAATDLVAGRLILLHLLKPFPSTHFLTCSNLFIFLVPVGEEIFGKYCEVEGACDWFTDREMTYHDYFKDEQGIDNGFTCLRCRLSGLILSLPRSLCRK